MRALPLTGMDDSYVPRQNGAERIVNMRRGLDGAWRRAGGFAEALPLAQTTEPIFSMAWFAQHQGGRQWLVWEEKASASETLTLKYADFAGKTATTLQADRTLVPGPQAGTTYVEHANWLYMLNGYDEPVRWNGRELLRVGFSVLPPAPTVQFAGYDQADAAYSPIFDNYDANGFQRGVGEPEAKYVYGYALVWVNDLGQRSPPGPIAWYRGKNPDTTSSLRQGLESLAVSWDSAPEHVRGVILLRTENSFGLTALGQQGVTMYEHSSYGHGAEWTVVDDKQDAELGAEYNPDSTGLWPLSVRYASMFKGTMFVAGSAEYPSRVWFSAPGFPEQMPAINYLQLGDSTTGPITGIRTTKNSLVVFKRRGIYLVKGNPADGFYSETLTEDTGCAAPRSLFEVPNLGTMFCSDSGFEVLVGALENTGTPTRVMHMTEGIANVWRQEVNKAALEAIRCVPSARDREVWYMVPSNGDDRPQLGLVFHWDLQQWSTREGYPFSCGVETRDHRAVRYFGTHSAALPGVQVYSPAYDINGVAVTSTYRSAWLQMGKRTMVKHVVLHALNVARPISLEWHVDRDVAYWNASPDQGVSAIDRERVRDTWGTAILGEASWQPYVPVMLRVDQHLANGFEFQWRARGTNLELLGADVVVVPSLSDIKKLGLE